MAEQCYIMGCSEMCLSIYLFMNLEWFLIQTVGMNVPVKSSYGHRVIYTPRMAGPTLDAHLTLFFECGLM